MAASSPADYTAQGRLSFPKWTHAEAVRFNAGGNPAYVKAPEDVRPHAQFILNRTQFDKLAAHLVDNYLPWVVANEAKGEKNALTAGQAKKIEKALEEMNWEDDPIMGLIKEVYAKTAEAAPDAVATLQVNGMKGIDLNRKVLVRDVSQLKNPYAPDGTDRVVPASGQIFDANDTTVELYPGSLCAASINLWAFTSGKAPGITASTSSIVFVADRDRFGGGAAELEVDDLFLDDDE